MSVGILVTGRIVAGSLGIGTPYAFAAVLAHDRRAGFVAAVSGTLVAPHMVDAAAGLTALLDASAVAAEPLSLLGVASLLFKARSAVPGWVGTSP